jgi:chemotaxis protein methyltransferase CheR
VPGRSLAVTLPLSDAVFSILRALVAERIGIHYDASEKDLFADRVSLRAEELEMSSMLDYYYHLRYDAAGGREMNELAETLVVNETYFFREVDQLLALVERILPPAIARTRPARVWSAACSSGEEPLTLAMMLADRGMLDDVEIVGTDISARILERAKAARFRARSLRALPEHAERWFEPLDEKGTRRVGDALTHRIALERANLLDASTYPSGMFDAIMCRNVLIYFDDDTVARVAGQLASRLKPDGVLCVGASESLLRFSTALECHEIAGAFFYRRASA